MFVKTSGLFAAICEIPTGVAGVSSGGVAGMMMCCFSGSPPRVSG